jgi:aspartate carbamoyltransferase catalytic subunit
MLKHLLQISDLKRTEIESLILLAESLQLNPPEMNEDRKALVGLLFYENSTRTRLSFELAAHISGIKTVNLDINTSSVKKDESISDTIQTLGAMGIQSFVIRHPESYMLEKLVSTLGEQFHFINAGDGQHAHPTQALLDMLTIHQYKKNFAQLRVGILGDSLHSRVAKSDIVALQLLGCRDIRLIGPKEWLLSITDSSMASVKTYQDIKALEGLDVIITLRVQKERIGDFSDNTDNMNSLNHYTQQYQLTTERLKYAQSDAIVMHPGPINRGVEIASEVADGSQAVILKQVSNGILMRTAIFESLNLS